MYTWLHIQLHLVQKPSEQRMIALWNGKTIHHIESHTRNRQQLCRRKCDKFCLFNIKENCNWIHLMRAKIAAIFWVRFLCIVAFTSGEAPDQWVSFVLSIWRDADFRFFHFVRVSIRSLLRHPILFFFTLIELHYSVSSGKQQTNTITNEHS